MRDTEILLEAQARATEVLDDSAASAAALLDRADGTATELLLQQRERAVRLLFQQHELALAALETAVAESTDMADAAAKAHLNRHGHAADKLREAEERVAAELVEVEGELAKAADKTARKRACAILMSGHREAAAILLEARMCVEAEQSR